VPIGAWHYVKFRKELNFDDFTDFTDFTELLSDTAISPYRKKLLGCLRQGVYQIRQTDSDERKQKNFVGDY